MKRQSGPNTNTWVEYVLDTYGTPEQLKQNREGKYRTNLALILANSPKVLGITLLLPILTARPPILFLQYINRSQVMVMMSVLLPFLDLPHIRYIPLPR